MDRIIVPTDFSDNANKALDYALIIAQKTGAKLMLLNAFDLTYKHPDMPDESYEMVKDASKEKLEKIKEIIASSDDYSDVEVDVNPAYGDSIKMIVEASDFYKADLIVMGTKGITNLKEVLLGTVTKGVLGKSKVPVLAVPEEIGTDAISSIMYATDYSHINESNLGFIKELSRALDAELKIVHVTETKGKVDLADVEEGTRQDLELDDEVKHSFEYIECEDVMRGIHNYIQENKEIDLLILVNHERRDWLEALTSPSMSKEIMSHPELPTLVLKDK